MKTFLIILLTTIGIQAQTVFSETFSNRRDSTKSDLLHQWYPDTTETNPLNDKVGSFNLTENGDIVYDLGSATKSGGYHYNDFSASNFFETASNFDITGNFTFSVWFKRDAATNPSKNMRFISSDNASTLRNAFLFYHNTSQTLLLDIFISNAVKFVPFNVKGSAFWNAYFDGSWHNVTATHDGSVIEIYLDGIPSGSPVAAVGTVDSDAIVYAIGASDVGSEPFDGEIDVVEIFDEALSAARVRENIGLFPGWVSNNGNVVLDGFNLTAYSDTLCVPLPDATLGTNQEWIFTLSNKDTVSAWIGSRASAKSTVKSIPGGSSFGNSTAYFGDGFSLSGDSLVIAFPADTASVDNVVLSKASHHLLDSVNKRNNLNGYGDY